jgi:hypothetical protein
MLSLRELQERFVSSLLSGDGTEILPWISDHDLPASEGLGVYRGNCREGFLAALAAGYPVLKRLTGADYFRQLVRDYQQECPSPSGNLFHAGASLPSFLERRFAGTEFGYFSHVARLEWACQEVLVAADAGSLDLGRLAGVSPANYARLRFELDPAARLVSSRYPIVRIWEVHQDEGDPDPIDISTGGEAAIVHRRGEGVSMYRLPPAEFACLAALHSARPLAAAIDDAAAMDNDFNLRDALRRWAQLGFIVDFSVLGQSADR